MNRGICGECRTCQIKEYCDMTDNIIKHHGNIDGEHNILMAIYEQGRQDERPEAFGAGYASGYENGRREAK